MFEHWSEQPRRAIFFARLYASEDQDTFIRPIHVLAGIGHEAHRLFSMLGISRKQLCDVRKREMERPDRKKVSSTTSTEIPLDETARQALGIANEISCQLKSSTVNLVHILLGVLRADPSLRGKFPGARLSPEDITAASAALGEERGGEEEAFPRAVLVAEFRSGIGYDLHRLEEGRPLIVGGVQIAFEKGPAGHSDGDVLAHAICDALLGAAGLGDIGRHFPDTEAKWKGTSSLKFLEHIAGLLAEKGFSIGHIDAVVILERPKLGPHFAAMRGKLAAALAIAPEQINLKAKTNEGVDAVGRGEAIAAQAVATVRS